MTNPDRCARPAGRIHNPRYDPDSTLHLDEDCHTEPLIIVITDRLKTSGLEQLRDFFDRRETWA